MRAALLAALAGAALAAPSSAFANHYCNQSINAAGAYALTHNLNCPAGTAVTISASNVTLDLGGYSISGAGTGTIGINIDPGLTQIVIRNGRIRGYETGIRLQCDFLFGSRIDGVDLTELTVVNNRKYGVDVCTADNVDLANSRVVGTSGTPGFGIGVNAFSADNLILVSSAVRNSAASGIVIDGGDDALVTGVSVTGFFGSGIQANGADADSDITIENSVVRSGTGRGIDIDQRTIAVISNTTVDDINGYGIYINCSPAGVLEDSLVRNAGRGGFDGAVVIDENPCSIFSGTDGWQLRDNVVRESGSSGILLLAGAEHLLSGNEIQRSTADGVLIDAAAEAVLEDNRARRNGDDGFQLDTSAVELTNNVARQNTGFGFETNGGPVTDNGNTANNNTAGNCSNASDLPNTSC